MSSYRQHITGFSWLVNCLQPTENHNMRVNKFQQTILDFERNHMQCLTQMSYTSPLPAPAPLSRLHPHTYCVTPWQCLVFCFMLKNTTCYTSQHSKYILTPNLQISQKFLSQKSPFVKQIFPWNGKSRKVNYFFWQGLK